MGKEDKVEVEKLVEKEVIKPKKNKEGKKEEASLAHAGTDVHALKQSVIEKTKHFAEAMESLESSSKGAMEMDFKEVFKMFKDDVASELGKPTSQQDEDDAEEEEEE